MSHYDSMLDKIPRPFVGIFVSDWETGNLSRGKCSNSHYYDYARTAYELGGLCCFFSISNIVWEQRLVMGWVLKNGDWTPLILPIPTVIYDRCFGPQAQTDSSELRANLARFQKYAVINAMPKLKKWETYELLNNLPDKEFCLPMTAVYSNPKQVARVVASLRRVYLKPDALSRGEGVYRITRVDLGYVIEHRGKKGNEVRFVKNLKSLDKLLAPYYGRGGGYLIQEEVPLSKYENNKFDMRVLCQKDDRGTWTVAGVAVRVSAPKSIITSPRSGGTVQTWRRVLNSVFHQDESSSGGVNEKIFNAAMKICQAVEERYGCCVELGLDIGVDDVGRVWLIEVNGKPLKVSLEMLGEAELTESIFLDPIRYACYLAAKPKSGVRRWNEHWARRRNPSGKTVAILTKS